MAANHAWLAWLMAASACMLCASPAGACCVPAELVQLRAVCCSREPSVLFMLWPTGTSQLVCAACSQPSAPSQLNHGVCHTCICAGNCAFCAQTLSRGTKLTSEDAGLVLPVLRRHALQPEKAKVCLECKEAYHPLCWKTKGGCHGACAACGERMAAQPLGDPFLCEPCYHHECCELCYANLDGPVDMVGVFESLQCDRPIAECSCNMIK